MKKIALLFIFSFIYFLSNAQTLRTINMPGFQQFGTSVTQSRINGILYPVVGYAPALYTDTTTANLNSYIDDIPGSQICTTDGTWWVRNSSATGWISLMSKYRFGFSGEDVTATANRTFTLGGYTFRFASGNVQMDSTVIIGLPDESPIPDAVLGINIYPSKTSFIKMFDTDDNVNRFDFRHNGDIYAGGSLIWEAANNRFNATRIDLGQRVVTPIISDNPGANDPLEICPGASDGDAIVGASGVDAGDYKFQATGGVYLNVTGKNLRIIDGNEGSGKVLTSDASGNATWQTASGGGSAGRLFKNLQTNTTSAGNVGSGEDNLMSYTAPADTLNTNGDYIEFEMSFTFAANGNNKQVKVKYGATTIYDSGAQPQNNGTLNIKGTIVRTGAATQLITFSVNNDASLYTIRSGKTTAAETLSSTVILKATGEATADNDIVQDLLIVKMIPNS